MLLDEFPVNTVYIRGERKAHDIYEAIGDEPVTFNEEWLEPGYKPPVGETPFLEVRTASLEERGAWPPILEAQRETEDSFEDYIRDMVNSLVSYMEYWVDPDCEYLCFHSSGYDSRILSGIFKLLGATNIHYRCHPPETELFTEYMNYLGIKNFTTIKPSDCNLNLGRKTHGWRHFGPSWNSPKEPNKMGIKGMYSGEMWKFAIMPLKHYFFYCENEMLSALLNRIPREPLLYTKTRNVLVPFMNYEYLSLATRCKREWIKYANKKAGLDTIREAMLKEIGKRLNLDLLKVGYQGHYRVYSTKDEDIKMLSEWWKKSRLFNRYQAKLADVDIINRNHKFAQCLLGFSLCYEELSKRGLC